MMMATRASHVSFQFTIAGRGSEALQQPEDLLPMFPKLKEIRIAGGLLAFDCNIPLLRYVNAPSVTHIRWSLYNGYWEWMSNLQPYPFIQIQAILSLLPATVTRAVPQKRFFTTSPSLSAAGDVLAYEHLCQLDTLTSLYIDISCHGNYARLQEAKLSLVPFPALTDIHYKAGTISDLVQWIGRHDHFPMLSKMTCEVKSATWRDSKNISRMVGWAK
ncbi:hypothetical protein V8E55_009883 [Tylopilus felleus]